MSMFLVFLICAAKSTWRAQSWREHNHDGSSVVALLRGSTERKHAREIASGTILSLLFHALCAKNRSFNAKSTLPNWLVVAGGGRRERDYRACLWSSICAGLRTRKRTLISSSWCPERSWFCYQKDNANVNHQLLFVILRKNPAEGSWSSETGAQAHITEDPWGIGVRAKSRAKFEPERDSSQHWCSVDVIGTSRETHGASRENNTDAPLAWVTTQMWRPMRHTALQLKYYRPATHFIMDDVEMSYQRSTIDRALGRRRSFGEKSRVKRTVHVLQ